MRPNNVLYRKCTKESIFRDWLTFLEPFHRMTNREMDVAARILRQYFILKDKIDDLAVLQEVLWTPKSRKDMMASLCMTSAHFQIQLDHLRKKGFLKDDNAIEPRYLPHLSEEPRFHLLVVFDMSTPKRPLRDEPKQD